MPIEMKMPRLSDTMEMGTIVRWAVKPGQKVRSGDVVADIETDKATMELQTFDDGTVAKLAVPEGQQVPVGTTIMFLAEAGENPDEIGTSGGASSNAAEKRPEPAEATQAAGRGAGAEAARGARGAAGGSSQTESVKGPPSGTRAAVAGEEQMQDERRGSGGPGRDPGRGGPRREASPQANGRHEPEAGGSGRGGRVFASPLARKIAEEAGVNLGSVQGTGPSGRIIRKDVEAALGGMTEAGGGGGMEMRRGPGAPMGREPAKISGLSAGAVPGMALPMSAGALETRLIPLSNMRGTIAKRLVQSKTSIPHYQVTVTARMDALMALRQQLNDQLASQGLKLSVNDFIVRACAIAMHQHPYINARWLEAQGKPPAIEFVGEVNIGVAIALPVNEAGEGGGLVVGTLRHADMMGLRQISQETKRLGEKARTRGLSIEEMSDTTFTISNLGMFGVEHFTAIINPPNSAILAVGAAVEKPVVETHPQTGEKRVTIGHEMQMTMSSDHRVIDGAMAAQYLATVKGLLQAPATLLV